MFKDSFNRFFPVPKFLTLPSFGLDISDESIKFIEFVRAKNGIKVNRYGEKKIPPGIIESGKIKDRARLHDVLISLREEEGIKSVRVSLPEEQVYLFNLKLEKGGLENVSEDDQSLKLQVAAIPKSVIDGYLSVFKDSGMSAKSFELEAQSIARAVIKRGDMGTYMIVDFGKKRTGIFIISNGIAIFTST